MATFSAVTRQHVLQAIAECDERGADDFLGVYGYGPSRGYELVHEGHNYDSRAILGVAHRFATGRVATADEFHGGQHAAAAVLRKCGFEVTEPPSTRPAARPAAPRTPRATAARPGAPARRPPLADRPLPICPTCSMALPGTGVCDNCG